MQRTSSGRQFFITPYVASAEIISIPVRPRTGMSTRGTQVAGNVGNGTDWQMFLMWLESTPPTVRPRDGRAAASTTSANFAPVTNRSILLTALYGTPSDTSALLPWLALLRLEGFVNFLKVFSNTDRASRELLVERISHSGGPDDKQVCAFARDLLGAAKRKPLDVAAIPGLHGLLGLAARMAGESPSHSIASPASPSKQISREKPPEKSLRASSREPGPDLAPKQSGTRQPASSRNIDRLLAAIRAECMVVMEAPGQMGMPDHPVFHFNLFLKKLLASPVQDWPAYFAETRLSAAMAASNAKYRALCVLKRQTDEGGFGAMANTTPHLALLSACLLGYDLNALWFGTALKGCRPEELAFWRTLGGQA
jgi:hypothetical protein